MTDIDLDLNGMGSLRAELEELEADWDTDAVFSVGTDRDYGSILEFGRGPIRADDGYLKFEGEDGETIFRKEVSGHPPYPWFRPAIREFDADSRAFLFKNTDVSNLGDIETGEELLASVAAGLQTQMEKNASANTAVDRSPGTHPEHPQRDTGVLVSSIQTTRIR